MKIFAEKLIKGMTLNEQNKVLQDLLLCEALIVAYESYLDHIGKKEDSQEYIHNFMENLTNEDLKKALK